MRSVLQAVAGVAALYVVLLLVGRAASAFGDGVWIAAGALVAIGLIVRARAERRARLPGAGR